MKGQSATSPSARGGTIRYIVAWLVVAAAFLHATQASFALPLGVAHRVNVSLVDVLLAVALAMRIACGLLEGHSTRISVPWAALAGVAWLGLSLVGALKGRGHPVVVRPVAGLVNVVQFAEYFLVGWFLFAETFEDAVWRRRGLAALGGALGLALLIGAVQYFDRDLSVTAVCGSWFADRNTYGMFVALALPVMWGIALFSRHKWALAIGGAALMAAVFVVLSGGIFLAICIGVLVVSALRGAKAFCATAVFIVAVCVFALPRLPRRNADVLLDSVLLYKVSDPHNVFHGEMERAASRTRERLAALSLKVSHGERVARGDLVSEEDLSWKWQQRWKEWQAALGMMARSPLFGVGAGAYQDNVNAWYNPMPKYPRNLLEPDTLSGYMVWGASAGIPFLVILMAMYLRAARGAASVFASPALDADHGLAAGLIGALVAMAVGCCFTDPLVRGTGVTVSLLLGLPEALRRSLLAARGSREGSVVCGDIFSSSS